MWKIFFMMKMENLQMDGMMMVLNGISSKMVKSIQALQLMETARCILKTENMEPLMLIRFSMKKENLRMAGMMTEVTGIFSKMVKNIRALQLTEMVRCILKMENTGKAMLAKFSMEKESLQIGGMMTEQVGIFSKKEKNLPELLKMQVEKNIL